MPRAGGPGRAACSAVRRAGKVAELGHGRTRAPQHTHSGGWQAHLNLRRGSGRKRLFIELRRSTRTRTGTADSNAAAGSGGAPRFHTTSTSPTEGQAL